MLPTGKEKYPIGVPLALMALLGASACGPASEASKAPGPASPVPVSPSPSVKPTSMETALNAFRDDFYKRRKADILMGFCMGWKNQSGGITVTYDPGLIGWQEKGQTVTAPVFEATDHIKQDGDVTLLNGPDTGDEGMITLVFDQSSIRLPKLQRTIGSRLVHGNDGDVYHTDIEDTGWPLINTRLVAGPFTEKHVGDVCQALRDDPAQRSGTTA